MTFSNLAVVAPTYHQGVNPTPSPVSSGSYLGGTLVFVALAVMVITGLASAGVLQPRETVKSRLGQASGPAH